MASNSPLDQLLKTTLDSMKLIIWVLVLSAPAYSQSMTPADEYKLKAALIYKLSKFVEWPSDARNSDLPYFNICLIGDDAFGKSLDTLKSYKAKGKPIQILRFNQSDGISWQCHILFVSDSKDNFLGNVLRNTKNQATLTISELSDFSERGGMIQFERKDRNIGFKINLARIKEVNLHIAAPLLELSTIVADAGH